MRPLSAELKIVYSPRYDIKFYGYVNDALGGLHVSEEGVLARDRRVLDALREAHVPAVMVLSGGYSRESYLLVAQILRYLVEQYGDD
jgi:histone deacetylase 11